VSDGTDADFVAPQGTPTLTFNAGDTTKSDYCSDSWRWANGEQRNIQGVARHPNDQNDVFVLDGEGVGTILDNDPAITVTIGQPRISEGNAGDMTTALFTVRLSDASTQPVTVKVSTIDGTALSTGVAPDYQGFTDRLLTFNPGGPLEQQIAVTVIGDDADEADETFSLRLSEAAGGILVRKPRRRRRLATMKAP
jgi:hypothetical protein